MKPIKKILSVFSLLALLTMTFTTSALAFDGRSGDNVVIGADEVIEDDVYVGANSFTLEGTIKATLSFSVRPSSSMELSKATCSPWDRVS